ncbi:hypothetical protein [Muricoccus aerilatus]|uniref:hypothetical protein n=1 Tax=Muricoccus aerilatus TaxID=452982 RepID=UPI0005C1395A|nr:hypothetical protein [Roseomonas aerilata]
MQRHSYEIGQSVELVAGVLTPPGMTGQYVITRLLPNDASDREYRVKSERDGHERVVRESQLRAGRAAALGKAWPVTG